MSRLAALKAHQAISGKFPKNSTQSRKTHKQTSMLLMQFTIT